MYWHARREPLPPGTKLSRDVVRRVWGFARDFRWQIAGYLFLLALSSLAAVVPALLVRELLNTAIPQSSFSLVNLIGLAAVGVALANAGLALGQRVLSSRIGEGLIYRLRTSLFDHVQRQPLAFFTHTQTGALTSRLNSDVVGAQRALTGTLGSVFSNLISLVTTLVTMFLLNWRITLIAVAVLPMTAGRTTFIIAHRLSTVRQADLIVVVRGGRITERGTFDVLMRSGGDFAKLYRTQFSVQEEKARALG